MTIDHKIIINLFEFFTFLGRQTKHLVEVDNYNAINLFDSDWPNRIYHLDKKGIDKQIILDLLQKIERNELPNLLTVPENNELQECLESVGTFRWFTQRGMAVNLTSPIRESSPDLQSIKRVESTAEAIIFAEIASKGFQYTVDPNIIEALLKNAYRVKLFVGKHDDTFASCGLSFYDSKGNAGLYMIATLPQYRGLGLGRNMTIRLMNECLKEDIRFCTLQASPDGEPIYLKLGFKPYKNIYTYKMNGENVRYQ
jgi:ribosomal protein S18 acetylase RimI-like enzyme